mmetsp:Transcript_23647/g.67881  ORF Transcript_23647/g.67881 Transcript_23647/m.67881 type:complete len:271 (+) Transcript_23647:654-1466(+)
MAPVEPQLQQPPTVPRGQGEDGGICDPIARFQVDALQRWATFGEGRDAHVRNLGAPLKVEPLKINAILCDIIESRVRQPVAHAEPQMLQVRAALGHEADGRVEADTGARTEVQGDKPGTPRGGGPHPEVGDGVALVEVQLLQLRAPNGQRTEPRVCNPVASPEAQNAQLGAACRQRLHRTVGDPAATREVGALQARASADHAAGEQVAHTPPGRGEVQVALTVGKKSGILGPMPARAGNGAGVLPATELKDEPRLRDALRHSFARRRPRS